MLLASPLGASRRSCSTPHVPGPLRSARPLLDAPRLAARAMIPKPVPTVGLEHLHAAVVSVREQAGLVVARLRESGSASFRVLVADADSTLVIVARFLALLELFKDSSIAFEQPEPLGELIVRWVGREQQETLDGAEPEWVAHSEWDDENEDSND